MIFFEVICLYVLTVSEQCAALSVLIAFDPDFMSYDSLFLTNYILDKGHTQIERALF